MGSFLKLDITIVFKRVSSIWFFSSIESIEIKYSLVLIWEEQGGMIIKVRIKIIKIIRFFLFFISFSLFIPYPLLSCSHFFSFFNLSFISLALFLLLQSFSHILQPFLLPLFYYLLVMGRFLSQSAYPALQRNPCLLSTLQCF